MTVEPDARPAAAARSRTLTVSEVTQETKDSVTISFEIPDAMVEEFKHVPGQFITVKIPSDRTDHVARCYSLSSSPHVEDFRLEIGIKRTENGYASNWLCDNAIPGMELTVLPPSGHFTAKNLDVDFLFFAGGSGITPVLSLIKSALVCGGGAKSHCSTRIAMPSRSCTRANWRRSPPSSPERFTVFHWLESAMGGIPAPEDVESAIREHRGAQIYTCGPAPFMDLVQKSAEACGVEHSSVHREVFQSLTGDPFDIARCVSSATTMVWRPPQSI